MATQSKTPKVGMPVVVRTDLNAASNLLPGLISSVTNMVTVDGKIVREPNEEGMVEVMFFSGGRPVGAQVFKYHKGAEFAMTWCWPEEVE